VLRKLGNVFLAVSLPFLLTCGEDELGKDIEIAIAPEKPFLSFAGSSYVTGGGETIQVDGPWFKGVFTITNKSTTQTLYVDALELTITNSANAEAKFTISLEQVNCPDLSPRQQYAIIPPNSSFSGDLDCDNTATDPEVWYFDGLPNSGSPVYLARVELTGFFYTSSVNNPEARARKFFTFTTK